MLRTAPACGGCRALRRWGICRRRRFARSGRATATRNQVSSEIARPGIAAQGMGAAVTRPLADVAEPDAAALSAAAVFSVIAQLLWHEPCRGAAGSSADHGGGA